MKNSSMEFEKRDANTIIYKVNVPAKGKEKLSFHYNRRNVRR